MVRLILDSSMGSYPVLIGTNIQRELRGMVARLDPTGAVIVTDTNVRPWAAKVAKTIKRAGLKPSIFTVPAGERSKSMTQLQNVLAFLEKQKIDRGGIVIAVGGGTVGDLAGLAAAVWQRGIKLVAVPTTLLAMVDSSIGGKTGVNGSRSKNAVGAFWQPSAVIADLACIETLPVRNYREAFAEVVKYAVAMDRGLFDLLEQEQERLLEGDSQVRAVAFGMRVAARLALTMGLCSKRLVDAQDELLAAYGLPDRVPHVDAGRVLAAIPRDKKARRGKVAWVMPRRLGHAEIGHAVPPALVRRAITKALA